MLKSGAGIVRAYARTREESKMIDWKNPTIQKLVDQGYRIAAHAYLQPGGRVNYTIVAKHPQTGRVVQGWSRGGVTADAIDDLGRRA